MAMRLARIIFGVAALYGLLVLAPGLFTEGQFNQDNPPAINHPEFYYGFFASALVWQIVFLLIARDPLRYRSLMLVGIAEKAAFFVPSLLLWQAGRLAAGGPFYGAMIDGVLMLLFSFAWWHSKPVAGQTSASSP
jgi:hypothetical protein